MQGSLEIQVVVGRVAGRGVRAVGRLIESTSVLENAARQRCVGQDNNGSFKLVRSEKVSETPSGVPLDGAVSVIESIK